MRSNVCFITFLAVFSPTALALDGAPVQESFVSSLLGLLPILLVLFVVGYFVMMKKNAGATSKRAEDALADFLLYIAQVNETRLLPSISAPVNVQQDEFVILANASTMYEYKAERQSTGAGTRIKIGGLPVYIGGSRSKSIDKLKNSGDGQLYLTNKRLLFVGGAKSFSAAIKDIVTIDNALDHITVTSQKRQRPVIFSVKNGFYWYGLVPILSQWQLTGPTLPGNINITN